MTDQLPALSNPTRITARMRARRACGRAVTGKLIP